MLRADVISLVLGVTAFTLHTVGLGSPYWWFVAEDQALPAVTRARGATFDFHYGIWVIRECTNGSCSNVPSKMHGDRAWLIGPAVLGVLASCLLLAAVVVNVVFLCRATVAVCRVETWLIGPAVLGVLASCLLLVAVVVNAVFLIKAKFSAVLRKLCVLLSAGSGGVIVLAVLIFYKKKAGLHPSYAPETNAGSPDWALFLSTFGGILGVANSILIGCVVKKEYMKGKEQWLFGIKNAQDLEIDVNALRKGELVQGKGVGKVSMQQNGRKLPESTVMDAHL